MHLLKALFVFIFPLVIAGCKSGQGGPADVAQNGHTAAARVVPKPKTPASAIAQMPPAPDTTFVDLKNYSADFIYDIKYATEDNFLKSKVYDCAECFLRLKTAKALMEANREFIASGYRIKIFDCYRPLDIQKRMWKIVPDANYVANPAKGSIHNRGGAVDITLVDASGKELDMGTAFDHFGPEAAVRYDRLPAAIKDNRKRLQAVMSRHGFTVLASEWWHFNFEGAASEKVSNFKWDCD